jgi:hypothetical protein
MAFGIKKQELVQWKRNVINGEIAFITHYWLDPRFPELNTVTKAGCSDVGKLMQWGKRYGLKKEWIHQRDQYPHFDLLGERQRMILEKEGLWEQIARFKI